MTTQLRRSIARRGGLVSRSALARRWGISRERARQLTMEPTFPKPLPGEGLVWLAEECDLWRAGRGMSTNNERE